MADKTGIEWTDATWNPVVGCSIVSPGCTNCYAMKMAGRIEAMARARYDDWYADVSNIGMPAGSIIEPFRNHYAGTTRKVNGNTVWTGKVALAPEHILTQPLRWKRGRKIFVNSMGDLFHEDVPDEWIDQVFAVMALAPQHAFQVLTKRSERMRKYLNCQVDGVGRLFFVERAVRKYLDAGGIGWTTPTTNSRIAAAAVEIWPVPNIWLGVSAEDQARFDERADDLGNTPAAVRFFSFEPLLGPIEALGHLNTGKFHWAIAGGESGHRARPMHPEWERSLRRQCAAAGVAYLGKQWGEWHHRPECAHFKDGCEVEWQRVASGMEGVRPALMFKVGKKRAGRLFDGQEHNGFPEVPAW